MPGLETIRSRSVADLSSIQLLFEPGTDLLEARQLVSERVRIVTPTLPTWAAPPVMMPPVSATRRVMHIGMTSDSVSMIDMSTTAYWKIRARLLRVPGVANVAIWGEQLQQQHVQVIPKKLRRYHVSLDEVMTATADSLDAGLLRYSDGAVIGTGGAMETPNQELYIRHILPIVSPEDLSKVVVKERPNGEPIVLGDVAKLLIDHQPLGGDAVDQQRPRPPARRREVPLGQHPRGHAGGRGGDRRDATRSSRDRVRHAGLPGGQLRRRRDPEPLPLAPRRCRCS